MLIRTIFVIGVAFYASVAQSQTLTFAGGQTVRSSTTEHDAYRMEMNFGWKPEMWRNDDLVLALNHAVGIMTFRDRNNVNTISWAPNLILSPARTNSITPYVQLGIGVAYLSEDKFESRPKMNTVYPQEGTADMGSHWQFESSVAVGLKRDSFSIRAKVYHYSNAGLADENQGMDVAELGISYSFN